MSVSIFYKTAKDSETGKRFLIVQQKVNECNSAAKALSDEFGFLFWRSAYRAAFGGISSCIFPVTPDLKIWKHNDGNNEFMPRRSCRQGKAIHSKIKALPTVSRDELNSCIEFEGAPLYCIGVSFLNDDLFGFEIGDSWGCKVPDDCTEITYSEYKSLFGKEHN